MKKFRDNDQRDKVILELQKENKELHNQIEEIKKDVNYCRNMIGKFIKILSKIEIVEDN